MNKRAMAPPAIAVPLLCAAIGAGTLPLRVVAHEAQGHVPSAVMQAAAATDTFAHLRFTPEREATTGDTVRAREIALRLRDAISRYRDTTDAAADGFRMAPREPDHGIYHFGNAISGLVATIRFDPTRPTALLYRVSTAGPLHLFGAMYTAPETTSLEELDRRVPLSIARWHRHVNICMPSPEGRARWTEMSHGHRVFGSESPIATKADCDAVGGRFYEALDGWMLHAYVIDGEDLSTIWRDGHDMHIDSR